MSTKKENLGPKLANKQSPNKTKTTKKDRNDLFTDTRVLIHTIEHGAPDINREHWTFNILHSHRGKTWDKKVNTKLMYVPTIQSDTQKSGHTFPKPGT